MPEGVSLKISEGEVSASGPKGNMAIRLPPGCKVKVIDGLIKVISQGSSENFGTARALIANMVHGVSEGWTRILELVGTGYRAETSGDSLKINIGFSHPFVIKAPPGISFSVEKTLITVSGVDKEKVGQTAAFIRSVKPPEPYKGKGIKYREEIIRRKAGKAAKAQVAA